MTLDLVTAASTLGLCEAVDLTGVPPNGLRGELSGEELGEEEEKEEGGQGCLNVILCSSDTVLTFCGIYIASSDYFLSTSVVSYK